MLLTAASPVCGKPVVRLWERCMSMGQYLLIPFLVGWTSIYQLFWCSPGVQGFDTLPYDTEMVMVGFRRGTGTTMDMPSHREQRTALATRACDAVFRRQFHPQVGRIQEEKGRIGSRPVSICLSWNIYIAAVRCLSVDGFMLRFGCLRSLIIRLNTHPHTHTHTCIYIYNYIYIYNALYDTVDMIHVMHAMQHRKRLRKGKRQGLQRVCDGCCSWAEVNEFLQTSRWSFGHWMILDEFGGSKCEDSCRTHQHLAGAPRFRRWRAATRWVAGFEVPSLTSIVARSPSRLVVGSHGFEASCRGTC